MYKAFAANGMVANTVVDIEVLRQLNQALRDAARGIGPFFKGTVGYPQQGVGYTGDLAPLVPQSIQGTLDSATYTAKAIKFWNQLAKRPVTSTLHEETRINEHGGMHLDPFIAEGEVGPLSEAEYERQTVRVKYLAEHIEVSDPATMVGSLGVNKSVLAQRTTNGTLALIGKLERALFGGDAQLSALHFSGLDAQLTGGATVGTGSDPAVPYGAILGGSVGNFGDLRGLPTTPQQLQEVIGTLHDAPNHAYPNIAMMEPTVYQAMVNLATAHGRHDQLRVDGGPGGKLTFGHKDLYVGGLTGDVPLVGCSLMAPLRNPPTVAYGDAPPPTPVNGSTATPAADITGSATGSKFTTADAGNYSWMVVAVGDKGTSAPLTVNATAVVASDRVDITITDTGVAASGDNSVRYYRVYRAPKGTAANYSWAFDFPRTGVAGASNTVIYDYNAFLPNTGKVYIGQLTQDVIEWVQLLDFTRRPLAQVKTTVPFLLMLFGGLFVKVPTKWHVLHNVSLTL
jgi:hypothetical protein